MTIDDFDISTSTRCSQVSRGMRSNTTRAGVFLKNCGNELTVSGPKNNRRSFECNNPWAKRFRKEPLVQRLSLALNVIYDRIGSGLALRPMQSSIQVVVISVEFDLVNRAESWNGNNIRSLFCELLMPFREERLESCDYIQLSP